MAHSLLINILTALKGSQFYFYILSFVEIHPLVQEKIFVGLTYTIHVHDDGHLGHVTIYVIMNAPHSMEAQDENLHS